MARLFTASPCPLCDGVGLLYTPRKGLLKKLRVTAGLTQPEAAAMARVTASYICDVEHGRRRWTRPMQLLYTKMEQMAKDKQRAQQMRGR